MSERKPNISTLLVPVIDHIVTMEDGSRLAIAHVIYEPRDKVHFLAVIPGQFEDQPIDTEKSVVTLPLGNGSVTITGYKDVPDSPNVELTICIPEDQFKAIFDKVTEFPAELSGPMTSIIKSPILSLN